MASILTLAVAWIARILVYLLFIRAILSWVNVPYYSTVGKAKDLIAQLTEPIINPFQQLMSRLGINTGMFDFSLLVAMIAIEFIRSVLIRLIWLLPL